MQRVDSRAGNGHSHHRRHGPAHAVRRRRLRLRQPHRAVVLRGLAGAVERLLGLGVLLHRDPRDERTAPGEQGGKQLRGLAEEPALDLAPVHPDPERLEAPHLEVRLRGRPTPRRRPVYASSMEPTAPSRCLSRASKGNRRGPATGSDRLTSCTSTLQAGHKRPHRALSPAAPRPRRAQCTARRARGHPVRLAG